jgi:hypothetical protein
MGEREFIARPEIFCLLLNVDDRFLCGLTVELIVRISGHV